MSPPQFQRNTRQRTLILEELRKLTSHPTATDLYEIVRRRMPKISLGTVYRNLDLLVEMGEIHKIEAGGGEARFDADISHHHHIRCECCGRMDDLPAAPLDLPNPQGKDCGGYRITGHTIYYRGVCPACRESQRANDRSRHNEAEAGRKKT